MLMNKAEDWEVVMDVGLVNYIDEQIYEQPL